MDELDVVVLRVDKPEHALKAGDIGTIVLIHGNHAGYEVEFTTLDGETVAVITAAPAEVRPIRSGEIAHVRDIEAA